MCAAIVIWIHSISLSKTESVAFQCLHRNFAMPENAEFIEAYIYCTKIGKVRARAAYVVRTIA